MDPRESMSKFKQADDLYREGKYAEALALLEEVNRANPNQKNVLFPAALCLEKLGRGQQALDLCEQLIAQHRDPRAQELKARLAPQTPPPIPAFVIPDIDLDYHPPAARVSPKQAPRQSGQDPLWIGGFVLAALVMFALATYFNYAKMVLSYSDLSAAVAAPNGQTVSGSSVKIILFYILGSELIDLLAGFAAAYAALKLTDQFIYANFVDNAKDIIRCVVLCNLMMLTCIGIAFVPRFLKNRYDMSVGKLAASIAIYLVVALLGSLALNTGSGIVVARASSVDADELQSLEIELAEREEAQTYSPQLIGVPAPPLRVATWVKGEPVDLAQGKGAKVYVIEFWATWCPPCRKSIPHLSKLQAKYKDKGVVVIGVSDEDLDTVKPFVQGMGSNMSYTVAVDQNKQTDAAYMGAAGVHGIPHAFIVDKQGQIVWHGHPLGSLEKELAKVL